MTQSKAAQPMLVLDGDSLTDDQLASARRLHRDLDRVELQGFAYIWDDPQRCRLDRRSWGRGAPSRNVGRGRPTCEIPAAGAVDDGEALN